MRTWSQHLTDSLSMGLTQEALVNAAPARTREEGCLTHSCTVSDTLAETPKSIQLPFKPSRGHRQRLCLGWSVGCPHFPSGFVLWKLPPHSGLGSLPLLCSQAGNTSFLVPALSGATAFAETGQASWPLMPLWIPFSQHVRVTETSPGLACLDTVCPRLPLGRALATQATQGWPLVGIWA